MALRQPLDSHVDSRLPRYEWAFDDQGRPVPIEQAARGQGYTCPLCGGKLISRQGEVKQFHYAHETEADCPPETVARIAAARWLALSLQGCLSRRQSVRISWPCRLCGLNHSTNLLAGVAKLCEQASWGGWPVDLALLDPYAQPRAVISLSPPEPDALWAFSAAGITTLEIAPGIMRSQALSLPQVLTGATIYGGICATQEGLARQGIVAEVPTVRAVLAAAALRAPYYAYGALQPFGSVTHVLTLGRSRVWLPPALWQRAVGGLRHTIQANLQIISQEWPQDDGSTVALFYITVDTAGAVAVRRFAPGEPVSASLANVPLRVPEIAAIQIARGFARD